MPLLADRIWPTKVTPEDGDLVTHFYVPALECAVRYDRSTGYFSATALALGARGVEGLLRNGGRMRLLVGCTLDAPEVEAIEHGMALHEAVAMHMVTAPLEPPDAAAAAALELLAWMVARGVLEVKVAVPCDAHRRPVAGLGLFHEKAGILEDKVGDRLAFNGSVNETAAGWRGNWESFHVFCAWDGGAPHVDAEEQTFARLWADQAQRALVMDVPTAAREDLLRFLPQEEHLPRRLEEPEPAPEPAEADPTAPEPTPAPTPDPRRLVWGVLRHAPELPGGERAGEATAAVVPWPHQARTAQRLLEHWPPRLLVADEVGLGKTITAGLLLRQAWISGQARRVLVLAPHAILRQWQVELREKFNLNWPIYDGDRLRWYPARALGDATERAVGRDEWHREPYVLASSQLVRRKSRAAELLDRAEPWDLVVLDEAHHARRSGLGERPNHLLRLMRGMSKKTRGLVLMTATPLQISPVEVWDLLDLLGLPPTWHLQAFLTFFESVAKPNPTAEEIESLAKLFRAAEEVYGELAPDEVTCRVANCTSFRARKLLRTLRDPASTPRQQLEGDERASALAILRGATPVARLTARHTRSLLRRYRQAGKLAATIAERQVQDRFVQLSDAEREVYGAMEDYVSSTYDAAAVAERNAVGFVMTTYRRRLASSFAALRCTLENRLDALSRPTGMLEPRDGLEDDLPDDEAGDEMLAPDEAGKLERQALQAEENTAIEGLLRSVQRLPTDSKLNELRSVLAEVLDDGYTQAMIFTQYGDTMDFLRRELSRDPGRSLMCFSGRGGEVREADGSWRIVGREEVKRRFRIGQAELLLCTDAAAEGLNFQFCGALVNYDLPWNPMKVEQRIGRIDRLGQQHPIVHIINLHYEDTIETAVYQALRERIGIFETYIGRLQPILSSLPRRLAEVVLGRADDRDRLRANLVDALRLEADQPAPGGLDLDESAVADLELPPRPEPPFDLDDLDDLIQQPDLLPPGFAARPLGDREYAWSQPGLPAPVRVTTRADYFEQHPESTELWSPGSPLFPRPDVIATVEEVVAAGEQWKAVVR